MQSYSTRNVSTTLQHQRSTKLLISRYESMDQGISRAAPAGKEPDIAPSRVSRKVSTGGISAWKKDRSPIGQSFRNLFSAFKKGKGVIKDRVLSSTRYISGDLSPRSSSFAGDPFLAQDTPGSERVPDKPVPPYSGPLLYLSRSTDSPMASTMLPVWTACTATLEGGNILITWFTVQGNPSTHIISLSECADVRSLALSEINPDERALLPVTADSEDLRVFEVLFEGKAREKFAARSVQERAGWVSAIW